MQDIYLFFILTLILISLVCIFNSRRIIKNRVDIKDENKVVRGIKVFFTLILIISLVWLYYII